LVIARLQLYTAIRAERDDAFEFLREVDPEAKYGDLYYTDRMIAD
jgi:hypothetical protein